MPLNLKGFLKRISTCDRKWIFWVLVAFHFAAGLFYATEEHRRGLYFDPFLSSGEYRAMIEKGSQAIIPEGDVQAYHRAAYRFAEFGSMSLADGQPSAWIVPGYSLALATIFKFLGYHFFWVVLFNALCLSGAYLFLLKTAELVFSERVALLALLLLAMNLRMAMFVGYVYTECLFVLLLSASIWITARLVRTDPEKGGILAIFKWGALGLLCGYGVLVRPVFMAFTAAVGLRYFLRYARQPAPFLLFLCASLIPAGLWVSRNQRQVGVPVLATGTALTLADGNQDYYKQFKFWDLSHYSYNPAIPSPPSLTKPGGTPPGTNPEVTYYRRLHEIYLAWKLENKRFYYWLSLWRLKAFLSPYVADMSPRNQILSTFFWLLTFPAAFMGLFLFWRNEWTQVLGLTAFLMLLLPAMVMVGPSLRYQVPPQLLLTLIAAQTYLELWDRRKLNQKLNQSATKR